MPKVQVHKVSEPSDRSLPVFAEFETIADRIRLQAYNLFAHRGGGEGHALEDWLAAERAVCWPAAELTETDGEYLLRIALAGFDAKEISVTATPREIMVKAAQKEEMSGGEEEKLQWSEFRSNDVFRHVELPDTVDVDAISASLKNGLLEITAPKAEAGAQTAREIELSTPS
jgi:HSP20 family protein